MKKCWNMFTIKYLHNKDLDREKWDTCISGALNGLIYARSWYLDLVSPGWEALVLGDYGVVMPLCRGRKFGISYIYPPYFTQQLGIFASRKIDELTVDSFLRHIPDKYRLVEISMNDRNPLLGSFYTVTQKANYLIDLKPGYEIISSNYTRNCRRNIGKAETAGLIIEETDRPYGFVGFIRKNLEEKLPQVKNRHYAILEKIIRVSMEKGAGKIVNVYTSAKRWCAAASFLVTEDRCIFSVCASTPEGKAGQAMYLLVDYAIRKYAGKKMLFDFSGSNIEGVAYFNRSFGAQWVPYSFISKNNLPWYVKFFKR